MTYSETFKCYLISILWNDEGVAGVRGVGWGRLLFLHPLPRPSSIWQDSDGALLSRLHVLTISSFLSHSWETLWGCWLHGIFLWKPHCLYLRFHWPCQKSSIQISEEQSTVPFGHWKAWGWLMSHLQSAGGASWENFHDALSFLYTVNSQEKFASLSCNLNRSIL